MSIKKTMKQIFKEMETLLSEMWFLEHWGDASMKEKGKRMMEEEIKEGVRLEWGKRKVAKPEGKQGGRGEGRTRTGGFREFTLQKHNATSNHSHVSSECFESFKNSLQIKDSFVFTEHLLCPFFFCICLYLGLYLRQRRETKPVFLLLWNNGGNMKCISQLPCKERWEPALGCSLELDSQNTGTTSSWIWPTTEHWALLWLCPIFFIWMPDFFPLLSLHTQASQEASPAWV